MIDMLTRLKVRHELKIAVDRNEARELDGPTCAQLALAMLGLQNGEGASHETG